MLAEANIVALRAWEIACIGMWAFGLWLVFRLPGGMGGVPPTKAAGAATDSSRLYLGLYTGASVLAFWDWLLGNQWFFRITFDPRFVTLFRVDGAMEPLWAGFSYGFFFGICALLAVRFGRWLDEHLGPWQYVAIGLGLGFLDIAIEGVSVGWLDLYRFNYRASYLWWGVPWTNIVFIVAAQVPVIFMARRLSELLVRRPVAAAVGGRGAPEAEGLGWLPFWAALPIAPAGIYVGAFVTTLLLHRLQPWVPVG
ncbi:MAG TPA: hypothetical protein VK848_08490 [Acidimicrobiia bacterium]|nr:hypothetical protein [Acidimicrobiia bacterium]